MYDSSVEVVQFGHVNTVALSSKSPIQLVVVDRTENDLGYTPDIRPTFAPGDISNDVAVAVVAAVVVFVVTVFV